MVKPGSDTDDFFDMAGLINKLSTWLSTAQLASNTNTRVYPHGDLVTMEILDPALLLLFLTHADPGVRHQDVGAVGRLHGVRGHQEPGPMLRQVAR